MLWRLLRYRICLEISPVTYTRGLQQIEAAVVEPIDGFKSSDSKTLRFCIKINLAQRSTLVVGLQDFGLRVLGVAWQFRFLEPRTYHEVGAGRKPRRIANVIDMVMTMPQSVRLCQQHKLMRQTSKRQLQSNPGRYHCPATAQIHQAPV